MERRIPNFLKKVFHTVPNQESKKELLDNHRLWCSNYNTKELADHIECMIDELVQEEEKASPVSLFLFKWNTVRNRAKRSILRDLLKDLRG